MNRVWQSIGKVWRVLTGDPVMLALVAAFIFFMSFVFIELFRADLYEDQVEGFRSSSQVQNLLAVTDDVSTMAEADSLSMECDVNVGSVFIESPEDRNVEKITFVNEQAKELRTKKPAFSSAAIFLDGVQDSRELHSDLNEALIELERLSRDSLKARYCENLVNVLKDAFFLRELGTTEGVSALFVGQIENFWVNLDNVIEEFEGINRVPVEFADQHKDIGVSLARFTELLREDTTEIEAFSRAVSAELLVIQASFESLRGQSPELEDLTARLQLATGALRN